MNKNETPTLTIEIFNELVRAIAEADLEEFGIAVIARLCTVPTGTPFTLDDDLLPDYLTTDSDLAAMPDDLFVGFQVREAIGMGNWTLRDLVEDDA